MKKILLASLLSMTLIGCAGTVDSTKPFDDKQAAQIASNMVKQK